MIIEQVETEQFSAHYDTEQRILFVTYRRVLTPQVTAQFYQWLVKTIQNRPELVGEALGSIFDFRQVTGVRQPQPHFGAAPEPAGQRAGRSQPSSGRHDRCLYAARANPPAGTKNLAPANPQAYLPLRRRGVCLHQSSPISRRTPEPTSESSPLPE